MSLTRRLRSFDPLHALPYELWLECIRLYARDQPEGPLLLFDISGDWRNRLLETPQLWTTIFYDGGHDEDCRAECFFHLSRNLPVEIVVGRTPGTMNGAKKYSHRIKSFLFWGNNILPDSTFGTSFLPYKLDDGWYSHLIRLYKVPPRNEDSPAASSINNAFSTLEELFSQRKSLVDQADPEAITLVANLAAIYYYQGRYKTAEDMALEVVSLCTNSLGELHLDTVVAISNLAIIHVSRNNPDKVSPILHTLSRLAARYISPSQTIISEELQVEVLEQFRETLGREHQDTITAASNLIVTHQKQERWNEVEKLQAEVLEQHRRNLGPDHRDTIKAVSNLTVTYYAQGRWNEAEKLNIEVLKKRRRTLGPDHPDTITALSNLAVTYYEQSRWDEARILQEKVMECFKKTLGQKHRNTTIAASNLAITYHEQGRWVEAEKVKIEVLENKRQFLGGDHPDTITALSNLAITYQKQGQLGKAEKLNLEVLKQRRRILDQDHPDIITANSSLAVTYHEQGRWLEAENLGMVVLEQRRLILGQEHSNTITAASNLAVTYHKQGRWDEAEKLIVKVLEQRRQILGQDHPATIIAASNLSVIYHKQGRSDEANGLQMEVLEQQKQKCGQEFGSENEGLHLSSPQSGVAFALALFQPSEATPFQPSEATPFQPSEFSSFQPGEATPFQPSELSYFQPSLAGDFHRSEAALFQSGQVAPRNLLEVQRRQKLLSPWAQGFFLRYGGNSLGSLAATLQTLEEYEDNHLNAPLICRTPERGGNEIHTCGLCGKGFPNRQKSMIHVFSCHWRLDNWSCRSYVSFPNRSSSSFEKVSRDQSRGHDPRCQRAARILPFINSRQYMYTSRYNAWATRLLSLPSPHYRNARTIIWTGHAHVGEYYCIPKIPEKTGFLCDLDLKHDLTPYWASSNTTKPDDFYSGWPQTATGPLDWGGWKGTTDLPSSSNPVEYLKGYYYPFSVFAGTPETHSTFPSTDPWTTAPPMITYPDYTTDTPTT